ncbi:MAG TPA: carboxymuconolactone decarboxylase family protein [Actinophytocola sp.]|jgi:alkylhydroperoxidase family enzyme|nr:carboxymuconolactone decarboxylase family protein [Actinophytocola sp.]
MQALMQNPASLLPDATKAAQYLNKAAFHSGVDQETLELVHLRASQLNGCSACVGFVDEKKRTEMGDRLWFVSAWREAPCYSDAERAALALAESMTRLADRSGDAISDELWTELTKHYNEEQVAGLIWWVATTNFYNRLNTAVREPAGPPSWA